MAIQWILFVIKHTDEYNHFIISVAGDPYLFGNGITADYDL
ncbi:MAG TPA: hypothetical protein VJ697_01820 [Nitrososphaeraceae archaeon]|nr:hypothetical protein [Nitrososphaeraceae archaeon]